MFLSAILRSVYVLSLLHWLIILLIIGYAFLTLYMPSLIRCQTLWILPVGCWIFLYSLLVLCSSMQLSYLEIVWSFWVLLLQFARQVQSGAHFKANYFLLVRKTFLSISPNATWIEIFQSSWWNQVLVTAQYECQALFLLILTDGLSFGFG